MASIIHDIANQLSDNWPAFSYIALMVVFSLRFLHERREETRTLERKANELRDCLLDRMYNLERLIQDPRPSPSLGADTLHALGQLGSDGHLSMSASPRASVSGHAIRR
jgi:hypothetical protein